MEKRLESFLDFNGQSIGVLAKDGQNWVALKPICDALGVDWNRQFKNLNEDEIFNQLLTKQKLVAADNRLRPMVALPEKWVYGWLLSIRSKSPDLKLYKKKCYKLLYDNFHGRLF